mmetsp:Transcript_24074/g.80914  ORF Transcript_24074/g.80914 Transcript_24074/m.80914 type:complete len:267 (+) Transcript_24074:123-923(+)
MLTGPVTGVRHAFINFAGAKQPSRVASWVVAGPRPGCTRAPAQGSSCLLAPRHHELLAEHVLELVARHGPARAREVGLALRARPRLARVAVARALAQVGAHRVGVHKGLVAVERGAAERPTEDADDGERAPRSDLHKHRALPGPGLGRGQLVVPVLDAPRGVQVEAVTVVHEGLGLWVPLRHGEHPREQLPRGPEVRRGALSKLGPKGDHPARPAEAVAREGELVQGAQGGHVELDGRALGDQAHPQVEVHVLAHLQRGRGRRAQR